jgi:hypothetical protein
MLPEPSKPQYEDSSHTLMDKIYKGRRYIGTSMKEPSPNGRFAVDQGEKGIVEMLDVVNGFFSTDWKEYVEEIKSLPLNIYDEYEPVKIEE